jgi:hypothetical protein
MGRIVYSSTSLVLLHLPAVASGGGFRSVSGDSQRTHGKLRIMADAGSFGPKPSSTAVRAQLDRILESECFVQSERLKSLLRFMVEQSLASRSIKQMDLAVEVFGKDESFDPSIDPLVRVQVGRLRTRLE